MDMCYNNFSYNFCFLSMDDRAPEQLQTDVMKEAKKGLLQSAEESLDRLSEMKYDGFKRDYNDILFLGADSIKTVFAQISTTMGLNDGDVYIEGRSIRLKFEWDKKGDRLTISQLRSLPGSNEGEERELRSGTITLNSDGSVKVKNWLFSLTERGEERWEKGVSLDYNYQKGGEQKGEHMKVGQMEVFSHTVNVPTGYTGEQMNTQEKEVRKAYLFEGQEHGIVFRESEVSQSQIWP